MLQTGTGFIEAAQAIPRLLGGERFGNVCSSLTGELAGARKNMMLQNKGFVGVKRAAEILDVAPNTVRAWGASGKITEYRHPANNYRLYKQQELEALLKKLEEDSTTDAKRQGTGQ